VVHSLSAQDVAREVIEHCRQVKPAQPITRSYALLGAKRRAPGHCVGAPTHNQ
jgi:hypothetical protein